MKVSRRTVSRSMVVIVAVAMVAAGCGGGGSSSGEGGGSATPKRGGTMVMAVNSEPATMDPASCLDVSRCAPVFDTLMRYDLEKKEFTPGIAQSFDSKDGKVWTLKLREGVKFSDGTDFDAEAVAYNWDRVKDPKTFSATAAVAALLKWKVVDPLTLAITLDNPNFQLPWQLTNGSGLSFVGSPTAIKAMGQDFGNAPIGAGPFVLKKWTRNSQTEYTANKDYWGKGLPYLDGFVLKVIGQDEQRLNALRSGEIHVDWSLLSKDAKAMKSEGYTVHDVPLVGGTGLAFNRDDPDMKDPILRQALLHAFDSKQINDAVYPGDKEVDALLSPENPNRDDSLGMFPKEDLGEAQKLFDQYLAKTGKSSLTVKFNTYAGIPALDQVSQILQSQMQKIKGLTFEINAMDATALTGAFRSGKFQLGMSASLSYQIDGIYDAFHTGGSLNFGNYSNPEVDAALETARTSNDPKVIADAYKVVNGEVSKDGPLRTWRYQTGRLYTPKNVKGLIVAPVRSGAGAYFERAWFDK